MNIDVCLAVQSETADLRACLAALAGAENGGGLLHVYASARAGAALETLNALQAEFAGAFGGYTVVEARGKTQPLQAAAMAGSGETMLLLNAGLQVQAGFFSALQAGWRQHPEAAGLECRQLPLETERPFHPVTLEVREASCHALCLRRGAFAAVGGFDARLPLVCWGGDITLRLRAAGHSLYYLPAAAALWQEGEQYPTAADFARYTGEWCARLLLAAKYAAQPARDEAREQYKAEMRAPRHFAGVRRVMLQNYLRHFLQGVPLWFWRLGRGAQFRRAARLLPGLSAPGRGLTPLAAPLAAGPFISVVVRTMGRPATLRGALASLGHQTYRNFEVVVVEDGPETSRALVEAEFSHLPLRYIATEQHIGRGRAGNLGLLMAEGEYMNFLDDDDYFYPDHLELMAAQAIAHPEADMILASAMAMEVDGEWEVNLYPMRFDRLDVFTMSQMCQIPLQSGMFKRSLYESCGGLAENMDGNEDWAMWMRFLAKGRRANPTSADIPRATSVFVQPADPALRAERLARYKAFNPLLFEDTSLQYQVSMADMRRFYDGMIADTRHLAARGELEEFLERQAARDDLNE